jgi:hypothetical protein
MSLIGDEFVNFSLSGKLITPTGYTTPMVMDYYD